MDGNIKSILDDDIQKGSNNVAESSQTANVSSDEDESFRTCDNAETGIVVNAPPEFSDGSDASDSENSSELFLSDNNDYDSDISDPGREVGVEEEDRNVETSFQRELLDYLGSLFNVSSRIRTRDVRQPVTVNDEQLEEYKNLREKVDRKMKILGVGSMAEVSSSDQSVARNLYYLLSARERGDWSSCRQCMRVIPMWTFETSCGPGTKNGSCGDSSSEAGGSDRSDKPGKMELEDEEEDVEEYSNVKNVSTRSQKMDEDLAVKELRAEEEESCLYDRGITIATSVGEAGYLNRGAQLWSENSDSEGAWADIVGPVVEETAVICQDEIVAALDPVTDDPGMEIMGDVLSVLNNATDNPRLEQLRKEKMESGVFKRTFQSFNSDEIENNFDTRCSYKKDKETFSNNSKKFKFDITDDLKEFNSSPILRQVSRIGQRDIKSAIYGSRWSVQRLGLERRFPVHEGCVNALNFSSTGDWIASGSDDREVVITDWQRNEQVSRFTVGHSSNIFQVRFLPGSNDLELVTCSRDRSVRYAALSSTGQFQYSRLLAKHNDACHKMDMPLDQPCLVISAGEDCRVLWSDVRGPKNSGQLCLVDKVPLYSVSCNPVRSQEFCVAGKDNRVYIYDRRKPKKPFSKLCPEELDKKPHTGYHVTSVVYSGDGNSVLASYNDEDIYLLSTRPGGIGPVTEHKYVGHRNVQTVTGVAFYGPNQEYIVSGSNDGHVLLWERETEALVNWFLADEAGVVNVLQPHPSMPVLATSGLDHDIKLWSMLAADRGSPRVITVDDDLIDRDQESSRIDLAWKTLADKAAHKATIDGNTDDSRHGNLPFNLRNLQVITALNWKMRSEAYPYSFDNTLENLIFMSRRPGENQLRNLFISDSDSNESYETVPNIVDDTLQSHNGGPGDPGDHNGGSTGGGGNGPVTTETEPVIDIGDTTTVGHHHRDHSDDHDPSSSSSMDRNNRPDGCRSS